MIYLKHLANGFTLVEIIIGALLLSIFALGSFKGWQYAQQAANITLTQFLWDNRQQQDTIIIDLRTRYSTIFVDEQLPLLKCLVEQGVVQIPGCR